MPPQPTSGDHAEWHRRIAHNMQSGQEDGLPMALEGIPVKWKCTVVTTCARVTLDSPDGCTKHPTVDPAHPPQAVQSMGRGNKQKWISVSPAFSRPASVSELDEKFVENFTELFYAEHRESLAKDFISNNFHTVFSDTGVQAFLKPFDPRHVVDARTPRGPRLTDELYETLDEVHDQSFTDSVRAVHTAPEALRSLVLDGCRLPGAPSQLFRVPRKESTLRFYARREKLLVLATLVASHPRNGSSKPNPITLSTEMNSAVLKLHSALSSQTAESAREQLDTVLDMLYFPPLTLTDIDQPFAAPLMAFLAAHCIDRKGNFASVKNLPGILLAPAQFAMRARGLAKLAAQWKTKLARICHEPAAFCQTYLAEHRLAPYSGVRFLMHAWSRASRNVVCPSKMMWIDDETLRVENHVVSVPRLPRMMRDTVRDLEVYIAEFVLCGIPLSSICTSIDLRAFVAGGNENSSESQRFRVELEKQGKFGLTSALGSGISSHTQEARSWRMFIHRALLGISAAMHTTGGLPPRTPDADAFCLQDLMYIADGNTVGIRSTVGKMKDRHNAASTSVVHVFPPVVAKLLFIAIRIVRPIELELLLADTQSQSDPDAITELYRTYIFASKGSLISTGSRDAALKAWTKSCFGYGSSVSQYRQLATALQRRFLPTLSQDPRVPTSNLEVTDSGLQRTLALRRKDELQLLFIQMAKDWHNFIGLADPVEVE
ncbi:hypothetical protein B0H14DRAFT_2819085 [Mycena olivaceomarginata]|nr:hypothetical protein B0H14DRAFT_2819085 [Mycena olivaceomarginata]